MIQFTKFISEKWEISESRSRELCEAFEKGDTPLYLLEHRPAIAAELESPQVWEIFDFLNQLRDMAIKKKRILTAVAKVRELSDTERKHIDMIIDEHELDDILTPLRPNPRSKGQLALKKGFGDLADIIVRQEFEGTLDDCIALNGAALISQMSSEDVLAGIKDVLAERFAYDESARTMVRAFFNDDGFFEVFPKEKKDKRFSAFVNKQTPIKQIPSDQLLVLFAAEQTKEVRIAISVQLFRITEMLRHHFILNPDAAGFDLICESIDEAWQRLLKPIVERDVKDRIRTEAYRWGIAQIERHFTSMQRNPVTGIALSLRVINKRDLVIVAVHPEGRLLGAATVAKAVSETPVPCERLKFFLNRHRPTLLLIPDDEFASAIESIVAVSSGNDPQSPLLVKIAISETESRLVGSDWMKQEFADLDPVVQSAFAMALLHFAPRTLMAHIGSSLFSIHPIQALVPAELVDKLLTRKGAEVICREGISIRDIEQFPVLLFPCVTQENLTSIRDAINHGQLATRNELLSIKGLSEVAFRNCAGFIVFPDSPESLDRTLVHPELYSLVFSCAEQLDLAVSDIIANPETLRSIPVDDVALKVFVEKKLLDQLKAGQRYCSRSIAQFRPSRRLKLAEIKENSIVAGRVTNVTEFGVFIDINAVCDGLVHISQVADTFVESAEQVVRVGDTVKVRILKIDSKKRRISLSMKNLGVDAPKIKPSVGQLSTLADHFKNR